MTDDPQFVSEARAYLAANNPFATMRQLGSMFGVSSHVIGKKLKEAGLRTPLGDPSQEARVGGYVKHVRRDDGICFWAWNVEKTTAVLKSAGLERLLSKRQ